MAEVLLFHHAQGQTEGFAAFADDLRRFGHIVHAPDLYDGLVFDSLDAGMKHAEEIGLSEVIERGICVADGLARELVYAGFSLGVLPAQKLAQTRPGACGALLFHSCVPISMFGSPGRPTCRCRSTPWEKTLTSQTRAIWRRHGRSLRRPRTRSCFYTRAINTFSPTPASRPITRMRLHCSASACSTSSQRADYYPGVALRWSQWRL